MVNYKPYRVSEIGLSRLVTFTMCKSANTKRSQENRRDADLSVKKEDSTLDVIEPRNRRNSQAVEDVLEDNSGHTHDRDTPKKRRQRKKTRRDKITEEDEKKREERKVPILLYLFSGIISER